MKNQDAMALANDIERSLPVAQWRLHGVQLWPVIRGRLIWAAFNESLGVGRKADSFLRKVGKRAAVTARSARHILRDLRAGSLLQSPADAVIVTDGIAATRINGLAYDIVADPLAQLVRDAGRTVNTWYTTYGCQSNRATPGTLIQWRLDAAQIRYARTAVKDVLTPTGYGEFLDRVQNAGLPRQVLTLPNMALLAARVAAMAKCFENWLSRAVPRLVFVNCYYTLEGAALMLACRRRGIASIDVQHGVQGDLHVAYGSWINLPPAGYELLPRWFWCWSKREARAIEAWAGVDNVGHRPLVGGDPWMQVWQDARAPFVVAADDTIRSLLRANARTVLVTLQWGMADAIFLEPLLSLIASAGTAWTWWIRLHPVMLSRREEIRSRLAAVARGNVRVDEPSDLALPALLRRADVHLTHSSSVVLQAASLGVRSVLTDSSATGYFPELTAEGLVAATTDRTPESILAALQNMSERVRVGPRDGPLLGTAAIRALLADGAASTPMVAARSS